MKKDFITFVAAGRWEDLQFEELRASFSLRYFDRFLLHNDPIFTITGLTLLMEM